MSDIIVDRKSASALVKYVRDRGGVVYGAYISANGVTVETVGKHVAALATLAFPTFDPKSATDAEKLDRKYFMNTVRNGLNYHLGKGKSPATPSTALLTSLGEAASLDDVVAAWHAAQA